MTIKPYASTYDCRYATLKFDPRSPLTRLLANAVPADARYRHSDGVTWTIRPDYVETAIRLFDDAFPDGELWSMPGRCEEFNEFEFNLARSRRYAGRRA